MEAGAGRAPTPAAATIVVTPVARLRTSMRALVPSITQYEMEEESGLHAGYIARRPLIDTCS